MTGHESNNGRTDGHFRADDSQHEQEEMQTEQRS